MNNNKKELEEFLMNWESPLLLTKMPRFMKGIFHELNLMTVPRRYTINQIINNIRTISNDIKYIEKELTERTYDLNSKYKYIDYCSDICNQIIEKIDLLDKTKKYYDKVDIVVDIKLLMELIPKSVVDILLKEYHKKFERHNLISILE